MTAIHMDLKRIILMERRNNVMKKVFIISLFYSCFLLLQCVNSVNENNEDVTIEMVKINAAGKSFQMGSANDDADEKPVHTVKFTYDFFIGKTEISQKEYKALMGVNPSYFEGDYFPVDNITWFDAVLCCNEMSKQENFDTIYSYTSIQGTPGDGCDSLGNLTIDLSKNGYRLPTEAEWEYACRAGTTTSFSFGENVTTDQVNYNGNYPYKDGEIGEFRNTTVAVGSLPANAFGLYEMHGNVDEWVNDWYGTYEEGTFENPEGPENGTNRILRGGGWSSVGRYIRSTWRLGGFGHSNDYGLRFARGSK